jgi:hypothetical protein
MISVSENVWGESGVIFVLQNKIDHFLNKGNNKMTEKLVLY